MSAPSAATSTLLERFEGAWRDDTPVFGCCRRSVRTAVQNVDALEVATLDVTSRVRSLRDAVEQRNPGHLDTHRCCAGHLADLAFDLPDIIAPVNEH